MRGLVVVLVALLLSSCAGSRLRPVSPEVSVQGVKLQQVSLFSQSLELALQVHNPNRFDIPLESLHYQLELAGVELGGGKLEELRLLVAGQNSILRLPLKVNLLGFLQQLGKVESGEALAYELSGTVKIEGWRKRAFDRTGELDVGRLFENR